MNKIFDKIVLSVTPPTNTNVLWIYPIDCKHYDLRIYTIVHQDQYTSIKKWTSVGVTNIDKTDLTTEPWYIGTPYVSSSELPVYNEQEKDLNIIDIDTNILLQLVSEYIPEQTTTYQFDTKNVYFDTRCLEPINGYAEYMVVIPKHYKINSIIKENYYEETKSYREDVLIEGNYKIEKEIEYNGNKYTVLTLQFKDVYTPFQITTTLVHNIEAKDFISQELGDSTEKAISQKIVTQKFNTIERKIPKVVSEQGESPTDAASQLLVLNVENILREEFINELDNKADKVGNPEGIELKYKDHNILITPYNISSRNYIKLDPYDENWRSDFLLDGNTLAINSGVSADDGFSIYAQSEYRGLEQPDGSIDERNKCTQSKYACIQRYNMKNGEDGEGIILKDRMIKFYARDYPHNVEEYYNDPEFNGADDITGGAVVRPILLRGAATPEKAYDVANKQYVDDYYNPIRVKINDLRAMALLGELEPNRYYKVMDYTIDERDDIIPHFNNNNFDVLGSQRNFSTILLHTNYKGELEKDAYMECSGLEKDITRPIRFDIFQPSMRVNNIFYYNINGIHKRVSLQETLLTNNTWHTYFTLNGLEHYRFYQVGRLSDLSASQVIYICGIEDRASNQDLKLTYDDVNNKFPQNNGVVTWMRDENNNEANYDFYSFQPVHPGLVSPLPLFDNSTNCKITGEQLSHIVVNSTNVIIDSNHVGAADIVEGCNNVYLKDSYIHITLSELCEFYNSNIKDNVRGIYNVTAYKLCGSVTLISTAPIVVLSDGSKYNGTISESGTVINYQYYPLSRERTVSISIPSEDTATGHQYVVGDLWASILNDTITTNGDRIMYKQYYLWAVYDAKKFMIPVKPTDIISETTTYKWLS